jgi:hypothetical protein
LQEVNKYNSGKVGDNQVIRYYFSDEIVIAVISLALIKPIIHDNEFGLLDTGKAES